MRASPLLVLVAFLLSIGTLFWGYMALGTLVALIFATGYLGGFLFWAITRKRQIPFCAIKGPYWMTWALFVLLHKVEENRTRFFEVVSSITGVPVPDVTSISLVMLLSLGVLPWLLVPYLLKRGHPLGSYFAWTFFACMGVTELAHFLVFPFLVDGPYRYFPGMASMVVLAPTAWWGMWRLIKRPPAGTLVF